MLPFGLGSGKISKRDASVIAIVFGCLFIFLIYDFIRKIRQGEQMSDMVGHIIVTIGVAVVEWGMIAFLLTKEPEEEEQEAEAEDVPLDEELSDEELLEEPEGSDEDGPDGDDAEGESGSGEE